MNMKSNFIILKSISIACVIVLCDCAYLNYYSQPENSKQRWLQSEGASDAELETAVMDRLFEFPLSDVTLKTIWVHVPNGNLPLPILLMPILKCTLKFLKNSLKIKY